MAAFLADGGIKMRAECVDVATLFPGCLIDRGTLVVDESKLMTPGDALHEAGHIALSPPEQRAQQFAFMSENDPGEEIANIAWCWAALLHLDIAPEDVFHATAYKRGDSSSIIDAARGGTYIGLPLLQYWGMTCDAATSRERGVDPFPHMLRWVR